MEAWQHVELTVTNCSFGLTIKFIVNTAVFSFCGPSIFKVSCWMLVVGCWLLRERCEANILQLTSNIRFLGDHSEGDPPVPIPNTEVKPLSPDGTARASVWERRKLPGLSHSPTLKVGLLCSVLVSVLLNDFT